MKHLRFFLVNFLVCFFLFLSVPSAHAALLTLNLEGQAVWNVLSFDSEFNPGIPNSRSLEVKNLAQTSTPSPDATIYLQPTGDRIQLTVESSEGKREADVTDYHQNIIEIEQISAPQTVNISSQGTDFLIQQNGISAQTAFPIQINAQRRELSLKTPSGLKYLSIFPHEAVENALKANLINRLENEGLIFLAETERGELQYQISGLRVIEIFNLFHYSIPVMASISASTGQVLEVQQPIWFSVLGFLFA